MDGRPNRRNKPLLSNSSGEVDFFSCHSFSESCALTLRLQKHKTKILIRECVGRTKTRGFMFNDFPDTVVSDNTTCL